MSYSKRVDELTPRQLELLQRIADGEGNYGQVGRYMGLSRSTIDEMLRFIRKRLKAVSTPNAVAITMREGVVK